MEHSTTLNKLADGVEFPLNLQDRIRFDPVRKRLYFRGFMAKTEFDQLRGVDNDWEYQRAVERLFLLSTEQDSQQFRRVRRILAVLVIVCLVLAAATWWQLLGVSRGSNQQRPSPPIQASPSLE